MNKNKICAISFFVSAICFYLVSILKFINHKDMIGGLTNLALGSTFLCLGLLWYKQWKNSLKEDKDININKK